MSKRKDEETNTEATPETPKPESFLDRMRVEHSVLSERLANLSAFIDSAAFGAVDQEERERLQGQRTAMTHYHEILGVRIAYHEKRSQ